MNTLNYINFVNGKLSDLVKILKKDFENATCSVINMSHKNNGNHNSIELNFEIIPEVKQPSYHWEICRARSPEHFFKKYKGKYIKFQNDDESLQVKLTSMIRRIYENNLTEYILNFNKIFTKPKDFQVKVEKKEELKPYIWDEKAFPDKKVDEIDCPGCKKEKISIYSVYRPRLGRYEVKDRIVSCDNCGNKTYFLSEIKYNSNPVCYCGSAEIKEIKYQGKLAYSVCEDCGKVQE